MLSQKERDFQPHVVSLEALVPDDNFYREVEAKLDLSFVRDLVRHLYKPFGRPSIDPVVFFKLQLIMFFEGIRSERQLMDMAAMRLDHRWYLGYDLDEAVPNHSSLTRIRDRFGITIFQQFFERIVELCIEADLVWGRELFFDGTMVAANADFDQQVPKFYWQATQAHLAQVFDETTSPPTPAPPVLVQRYDGSQRVVRKNDYKRQADYFVNPHDPQATPTGRHQLGYRLHYVVDGGRARVILAALATPSAIHDPTPMLDLAWWTRFRWQLKVRYAVADQRYGTSANLAGLESNGLTAFIPVFRDAVEKQPQRFPKSMFTYDPDNDHYICPQGHVLNYRFTTHKQLRKYQIKGSICRACPLMPKCTKSRNGRSISHSIHKVYEDRVASYQPTAAYKKAMRKRQVWIEPKFGEVKDWHQGRRYRLRGILKVNIEALLKAAGQNIKQLLKGKPQQNRPQPPANVAALRLFSTVIPTTVPF